MLDTVAYGGIGMAPPELRHVESAIVSELAEASPLPHWLIEDLIDDLPSQRL